MKLENDMTSSEPLRSLVYKSRCEDVADWDLVNSILTSSSHNNPKNGLTGLLVATKTHFLQVLEGEFEALNATFERISRDKRHVALQMISFTVIKERQFADWAMHGIGLFDLNPELKSRLCAKFGEENGNFGLPSTAHAVEDLLNILLNEQQLNQAAEQKRPQSLL